MQAIISILTGMTCFIISSGMQLNAIAFKQLASNSDSLAFSIYTIDIEVKVICVILGIAAIFSSILYIKTGKHKLKIISKLGMILGIIGIIISIIPFYLLIN